MQNAVGVDIERYLNLRHAPLSRRNIGKVKTTQGFILRSLLTLTLHHVNGNRSLVVFSGREDLRFLRRNRGVLLDNRGSHTTHGFNTQG